MNYQILPKERPLKKTDASSPPTRLRQRAATSTALKFMLALLLALVPYLSWAGSYFGDPSIHSIAWQPTVESPYMQINLCMYDATSGSNSFFLHDAAEEGYAGPAVYVDGKYIGSPNWELSWPGHSNTGDDDALEAQRKYNGWWGSTYTKTIDGVTYTIRFWDPGKNGNKYYVTMFVFIDNFRVDEEHTVKIRGKWKINNNGSTWQECSWTSTPIPNPFKEETLSTAYTDYSHGVLNGDLNESYDTYVSVSGKYPGSYVDGKTQYVDPENFGGYKLFEKGTTTTGDLSYTLDSSYPDYGPHKVYVQHHVPVAAADGRPACNVWSGTEIEIPDYIRAEKITYSPDMWKKQLTLNWETAGLANENTLGTWSIYRYPKEEPNAKVLVADKLLSSTRKYVDDVPEYESKYVYEVEFRPKNIPDADRIDRLVRTDTCSVDRKFTYSKFKVNGGKDFISVNWIAQAFKGNESYTFKVYRTENYDPEKKEYSDWEEIGSVVVSDKNATQYTYTDRKDLEACTVYYYKVAVTMLENMTFELPVKFINGAGLTGRTSVTSLDVTKGESKYVKVSWDVDQVGADATRFELMRTVKGKEKWVTLYKTTGTYANYFYEDNTALPGQYYDYKLAWITSCGSKEIRLEKTDDGFCSATGTVSGRISYGTGTAVGDARVTLVRTNDDDSGTSQFYSLRTQGAGDGVSLYLDSLTLTNKFVNSAYSVQMLVRPDDKQDGASPTIFDLGGKMQLQLGAYDEAKGYPLILNKGSETENTDLYIPALAFTSVTLSVDANSKPTVTCVSAIDSLTSFTSAKNYSVSFAASDSTGICLGGSFASSSANAFEGYIDEMRVYSGVALSQADILKNYNHSLVGTEEGLYAYWPVDEGIERQTTAYDYSKTSGISNGNHGRLGPSTSPTNEVLPTDHQFGLFGYSDAQGNYVVRGVPFSGEGTNYMVVPTLGIHEFSPQYLTRFVSTSSLVHSGVDFTDVSSFPVSGYVLYAGTDYPVEGCYFYVDGDLCSKDGAPVTSASDGSYTISVPIGDHHIQVKKDGHTFASEGRYPADPNGLDTKLTFDRKVQNLEFVDNTLVNFTGKVVGGDIEGNKTVGFGLSKNNIGITELVLTPLVDRYRLNVVKELSGTTYSYETNTETVNIASSTTNINSRSWRGAGEQSKKLFIRTDSVTGEFSAMIPPLNYKVESMKVVATGLQVAEATTIDATNPLIENSDSTEVDGEMQTYTYNCILKKTYHSTPSFTVTQRGKEDGAFGLEAYEIEDANGKLEINDIYSVAEDGTVTYKYGGAIFESEESYVFDIYGYEEYENHDVIGSVQTDRVPLSGSVVTIENALSSDQSVYIEGNSAGKEAGSVANLEKNQLELDSVGKAVYKWKAGLPNITPPYSRTISMNYTIGNDDRLYDWSGSGMNGIILGSLPTGNNFVTSGPDVVDMILRDPPGTRSSAEWTSGSITSSFTSAAGIVQADESQMWTQKLGVSVTTVSGIGVGVFNDLKSENDLVLGIHETLYAESGATWRRTTTATRSISTSSDPEYVGANGDVFVGSATNMIIGKARDINFRRQGLTNDVALGLKDVVTTGLSFTTAFNYSANYIENVLLPNLRSIRDGLLQTVADTSGYNNTSDQPVYLTTLSPDDPKFGTDNYDKTVWGGQATSGPNPVGPSYTMVVPSGKDENYADSVAWCNTQISNWIKYLSINEQDKVRAYDDRSKYLSQNLSFDSGASVTITEESEATNGYTVDTSVTVSACFSNAFGFKHNDTGVIFEVSSEVGVGTHVTNEGENTDFASFSYTLAEEGDDDALTVDVYKYGGYSPIFRTRGGQTSGPYEGEVKTKYYRPGTTIMDATMQIEVPHITVDVPTVTNVPTGEAANYTLRLTNASEIDEDVYYKLLVIDESNPDGAKITIDGQPLTENRIVKIPAGETITKALQLTQTNLGVLEYNNIGVVLASQSQYDPTSTWDQIADTVYISAQFIPSSSAVAMKLDHTTLNTMLGSDPVLNVSFNQFDRNYNNLKAFRLQYRKQGDLDWTTFHEYVLNEQDKTNNNEYLPEEATVSYALSMKDFSDATYLFRVLSVSTYGNDEVYNQSEEITVIKDMSRPQPLGLPQPTNGILNAGDEISIQFNENILKGQLTNTANFRVTGVLNGATVQHDVALDMATDEVSATTEADILLSNHDFSIDAWVNIDSEGAILAHGEGSTRYVIGTDAQGHLTVGIGEQTYTSNEVMPRNKWIYLTTSYKAGAEPLLNAAYAEDSKTVTLFYDTPANAYDVQGKLTVGDNAKGSIHELTLWDEAHDITTALLNKSKSKKPSTPHLIGYWKMNEGEGTLITDYARSRHMKMAAETWKIDNENKAISIDGTSHVDINTTAVSPLPSDNCTIELWVRAGEQEGEAEIAHIGEVELWMNAEGKLQLSSLGNDYAASQASLLDNAWHHIALNILRTGHASVYVDGKRTLSTSASNVGQTATDRMIIGARRSKGTTTSYDYDRYFKGSIDEVRLWNATLSADLLKNRQKVRLTGEEDGLVAYYPFETKRLNNENQVVTEGSAKDLLSDNVADCESGNGFEYTTESPALRAAQTETNVAFSFTASDDKVVLNILQDAAEIEGSTLHFTAKEILDLNGNQSLPVMWTAYVNCNELAWDNPSITINKQVGEAHSFEASFTNNGGTQQVWTLSGLPSWLTASVEEGAAEALTTTTVNFDISEGIAIGKYEETVYLTGNDDISSALTIRLIVTGEMPQWSVNPADYENSMNLIGTLSILGQPTDDAQDLVAVFIDGECRGVAHPTYNARYDNYFVQLDIYGNTEDAGKPVVFYAYDNSTGTKYPQLNTSQEVVFRDNQVYGTFAAPVVLNADDLIEQSRNLVQGWNWVSFYVHADEMGVENIFSPIAERTDVVKSQTEFGTFENGQFYGKAFETDNRSMYRVHTTAPQMLNVIGRRLTTEQRTITLQPDWNWIAYNAMQTTSVGDALAGINPQDGDLIKGQKGFALYDGYEWNGSLKALTPGQGYMLRSSTTEERTFEYPTIVSTQSYAASKAMKNVSSVFSPIDYHMFPGNMCIVASIKWNGAPAVGYEVGVFDDSNCRCVEISDEEGYAYFTVPGNEMQTLHFKMANNGDVYDSDVTVMYVEDALIGTHSSPLILSFNSTNNIRGINDGIENGETLWYTINGALMPGKPTASGVYICRSYDMKAQTVKINKVIIK